MQPDVRRGLGYVVFGGLGVIVPLGLVFYLFLAVVNSQPTTPAGVQAGSEGDAHARAEARRVTMTAALEAAERVRQDACAVAPRTHRTRGITRDAYEALPTNYAGRDWTLEDLTCLLGVPGEEVSAVGELHTYRWHAPLGGVLVLTLKEDLSLGTLGYQIVSKAQFNLP